MLYLTKDLMFNKANGKSIYHAFSMTSYFTGVIGAKNQVDKQPLHAYTTVHFSLIIHINNIHFLQAKIQPVIPLKSLPWIV